MLCRAAAALLSQHCPGIRQFSNSGKTVNALITQTAGADCIALSSRQVGFLGHLLLLCWVCCQSSHPCTDLWIDTIVCVGTHESLNWSEENIRQLKFASPPVFWSYIRTIDRRNKGANAFMVWERKPAGFLVPCGLGEQKLVVILLSSSKWKKLKRWEVLLCLLKRLKKQPI